MFFKRVVFVILFFGMIPGRAVFAQSSERTLMLDEALELAKARNQEIVAAQKRWEEEKAKIAVIKSWPDPQLGVEFWGKNETWYDVSQTIPFPGKLSIKGEAQAHEAQRQMELYQAKGQEILQKVKAAYYGYFLARRQKELFEESVELSKHFSIVAENKYAINQTSQVDVLKAQLEYSKALNMLVTLGQDVEVAEAELNALLNQPPETPLGKPTEPPLPSLDVSYPELEKIALEKRPELLAAQHHVNHMQAELSSARTEFLPDTMVQYSRRTFSDSEGQDDNIVMVKFNVPLWFWKQGSMVKAARQAKEGADAELQATETMTRADLKTVLVKAQTARRLVELYRTSVIPQAETALRAASVGYESGTAEFLDVVDSQRSWLEFQVEYFQALAQYWSYLAGLERVVGTDLMTLQRQTKEARTS